MKFKTTNVTIIGNDTSIKGVINSKGTVDLSGKLESEKMECETFILRKHGVFCGNLFAKKVVIYGSFDGELHAESVSIFSGGLVTGKVFYNSMLVENNGIISGECTKQALDDSKINSDIINNDPVGDNQ